MAPPFHLVPLGPRGLVNRPRLWNAFGGAGEPTLVWGPRGSGKTTAVVDWVRHGPRPRDTLVVWIDGESRAWERDAFWQRTIRTLREARGEGGHAEPSPRPPDDARLGAAVRDVLVATGRPVVLVLDGIRRLQAALLQDLVDISATHESLRVAIVLEDQLQPDARRVLRSADVAELGPAELAFTPDEAEQLLGRGRAAPLQGYGHALHRLTAGEPLVTAALVRELRRMDSPPEPDRLQPSLVRDVVGLDGLDSIPGAAGLLRRLGLARHPTLQLARLMAEDDEVSGILDQVEDAGLGIWSPTDAEPRFHLAPAAASLLEEEVPLSEEAASRILREVSEWALAHGDLVNALGTALALDDDRLVMQLMQDETGRLMTLGPASLEYLLRRGGSMPGDGSTWLPLLAAIAYAHHVALRAIARPALADVGAGTVTRDSKVERVVGWYVEMVARRAAGESDAVPQHRAPPSSVTSVDEDRTTRTVMAEATTEWALHLAAVGYPEAAYRALGQVIESDSASTPSLIRLRARVLRAVLRARDGDLSDAATLAHEAGAPDLPSAWRPHSAGVPFEVLEGWLAIERLDVDRALRHLWRAEALADPVEFWTLVAEPLSRATYLAEPGAQDWNWLERRALPDSASDLWRFNHARAWALRDLAGDDHVRALSRFAGLEQGAHVAVEQARAQLRAEELEAATQLLDQARIHGLRDPRVRLDHAALAAVVELRDRDTHDGLRGTLDTATALARDELAALSLAMLPAPERDLLLAVHRAERGPALLVDEGRWVDRVRVAAGLSEADLDILGHLAQGLKLTQIATLRVVSINTVKSQLQTLYRRLGVSTRVDAVDIAARLGLVDPRQS